MVSDLTNPPDLYATPNLGEDTGKADFKSTFDTPHSDHLYATMSEFGIPAKLIRLCEMTLKNVQCVVKIGNNLSELFDAKRVIPYPAISSKPLWRESSARLA